MGKKIPTEKQQRGAPQLKPKLKADDTFAKKEEPRVEHKPIGSHILWLTSLPPDVLSNGVLPVLGATDALRTVLLSRAVSRAWRAAWDGYEVVNVIP